MTYAATFDQQSNKADFIFEITATDMDTGSLVDFTTADVACAIKDKDGCQVLQITIGSGITLIDPTTLEYFFTKSQIGNLCGHYKIGSVYEINGETNQLFVGTVSFYDGIASV
jgi:hypothetical protein